MPFAKKKKSDKVKVADASPKKRRRRQVSSSEESEQEEDSGDDLGGKGEEEEGPVDVELYEIERIVARKPVPGAPGKYDYQIKWLGFPDSDNSWEPEYLLKQYAHWVADFNRAEDEQIKFLRLKQMLRVLLSVSKAPPEAFAGVDVTGLGVEVPGLASIAVGNVSTVKVEPEEDENYTGTGPEDMEDDPYQDFDAESSIYSEMAEVSNDGDVTLPLGAGDVELAGAKDNNQDLVNENSHEAEDPAQANGHAANLEVMERGNEMGLPGPHANPLKLVAMDKNQNQAAAPTKPGNEPVFTSTNSVPPSDMFAINQKLIKENKELKSKLEEKDESIKQLDAELHSVKDSRRLMETKLFHETNELKDALHTVTQMGKDLHSMEEKNTLLHEQVKKIHRENIELAEMVTERDGQISTLEQELESLDNANDHLKEELFKKQDEITALKANQDQLKYGGISIPLGSPNKDDLAQLQKALEDVQYYKCKLESKVTALIDEKEQLLRKLAEKSTRVSALEGELQHLRAINQQQKDNLMSKEDFIASLKRAIDASKRTDKPTPNPMMESQMEELEESMKITKFKNVRLNLRIGELRRKIGEMHRDHLSRTIKLRGENRQLRNDLIDKDSLLRERTRLQGSCMEMCKDMLTVHKKEHGLPMIPPDSGSGSDSDDIDNNRE